MSKKQKKNKLEIDITQLDKHPAFQQASQYATGIIEKFHDDLWFHAMVVQAPVMYRLLEDLGNLAYGEMKGGKTTVTFEAKELFQATFSVIQKIILVEYHQGLRKDE